MSLTPYHAKYLAHDLTRRAASGMDRLSMALFDALHSAPIWRSFSPSAGRGTVIGRGPVR